VRGYGQGADDDSRSQADAEGIKSEEITVPTPMNSDGPCNQQVAVKDDNPIMRFDREEVPLLGATDLIGREVTWAIAHITGIVQSATEAPTHFDLS
jgi:hypothetical protein